MFHKKEEPKKEDKVEQKEVKETPKEKADAKTDAKDSKVDAKTNQAHDKGDKVPLETKAVGKPGDKIVNTKDLKDIPSSDPLFEEQKQKDAHAEKVSQANLAKDRKAGLKLEEEYKKIDPKTSKVQRQDKRALSDISRDLTAHKDINDADLIQEFKPGREYKKGDLVMHQGCEFEAVVDHEGLNAPNLWKAK